MAPWLCAEFAPWASGTSHNPLAHAPERLHEEITADYTDMIYAATRQEIEARRKAFIRNRGCLAGRPEIREYSRQIGSHGESRFMRQGSGYFPYPASSFMVNQTRWIYYGGGIAALGLLLIIFTRR
jgi:hypothetical protein